MTELTLSKWHQAFARAAEPPKVGCECRETLSPAQIEIVMHLIEHEVERRLQERLPRDDGK